MRFDKMRSLDSFDLTKGNDAVILNADEMGILRKILINSQGIDRTKSLFTRYGWICGYNEALRTKDQFDSTNYKDLVLASCFMQSAKGMAKIDTQIIEINGITNSWIHEGKFLFSSEVQQFMHHFGYSDKPVCWFQIGYMGGYGTGVLGKNVYYREAKCLGRGDPHCEFIGKTLDEWDEKITSELPYYEEKNIRDDLDAAYKQIRQQSEQLERSFALHQQLTELVLNGVGLAGIVQVVAKFTGEAIFIFNNQTNELVFDSPYDSKQSNQLLTKMTSSLKDFCNAYHCVDNSVSKKEKIIQQMNDFKAGNKTYNGFAVPVIGGGSILGYVATLYEGNKEVNKDSILCMQQTANLCALVMIKQKEMINLEQQFRWDFIDHLFSKMYSTEESIIAWGAHLGHDITKPHRAIAMTIEYNDTIKTKTHEELFLLKKNTLRITNNHLKISYPAVLISEINNRFVILFPEKTTDKNTIRTILQSLKKKLEEQFPQGTVLFGVGGLTKNCGDYLDNSLQANKAHMIMKSYKKRDWILFYEDLGSLTVLLDADNKLELLEFMKRKLKPLIEHDLKHNSGLIKSMDDYLSNDSLRKTSQLSSISISGLKYRLNKIKEFGYDLQCPQERYDLQLALQIYRLIQ